MRHRVIPGLAVLAALTGSLVAGCGSAAKAPASSTTSPTTATTTVSASASTAAVLPAADCAVIKPIAAGAATSLAPVATEPSAAAATTMATYITQLSEALAKVTSTQGKADLGAFIEDLKTASAANAAAIQAAIQKLSTDCP